MDSAYAGNLAGGARSDQRADREETEVPEHVGVGRRAS
jgi:hypothetical protein